MHNEAIEACGENGFLLHVEFERQLDRYGHTISMVDPSGGITPLLRSGEGVTEDDWPPSPPLQTLSMEKLSDARTVALLVGMAGRSHWSESVEPVIGEAKIVFDVACRYVPHQQFPRPPGQLGSHYYPLSPLVATHLSIESDNANVLDASGVLEIVPRTIMPAGTTRWRYTIAVKQIQSPVS